MGESPATYEHADAVAALTARVRREHPGALATAIDAAPALRHAFDRVRPGHNDELTTVVAFFQHLTSTELAHLPDRDAVANDVITAGLYESSGIDYAATSIEVYQSQGGQYRVRIRGGSTANDRPVPAPGHQPGVSTDAAAHEH